MDAYDRARANGFAASTRPSTKEGVTTYEMLLRNLPGKAEAQTLVSKVKTMLGLEAGPMM